MSLRKHLESRKNKGIIDFIEVPLDWGRAHKEFIVFNLEDNTFCRLFFDNKYRQDDFTPDIKKMRKDLEELSRGLSDIGLYNTKGEYSQKQKEVDFVEKYLTVHNTHNH